MVPNTPKKCKKIVYREVSFQPQRGWGHRGDSVEILSEVRCQFQCQYQIKLEMSNRTTTLARSINDYILV